MVGVVFSDRPDPARAFVKEFAVPYVNVLDPQSRVAIDYGVSGIPETFFTDALGRASEAQRAVYPRRAVGQRTGHRGSLLSRRVGWTGG